MSFNYNLNSSTFETALVAFHLLTRINPMCTSAFFFFGLFLLKSSKLDNDPEADDEFG